MRIGVGTLVEFTGPDGRLVRETIVRTLFASGPKFIVESGRELSISKVRVITDPHEASVVAREVIVWRDAAKQLPDDDISVLIETIGDESVPEVWQGYHSEGKWRNLDGLALDCTVLTWADVPVGGRAFSELRKAEAAR